MFEAISVPIIHVSPDETIRSANGAARDLFPVAEPGRHYITALRQPAMLDAIEGCLSDGVQRHCIYLGREGGQDSTWSVVVMTSQNLPGVVLTFEDRTEAQAAEAMHRDFVTNVSHELRTPLTAVMGFIETLRDAASDDAAARTHFLRIMQDEAGRMSHLIEDLLALNRVEREERQRPTDTVEMRELIEARILALTPLATKAGVTLVSELPKTAVTIPGDPDQLAQLLGNLMENAFKYGGQGRVIISLTPPEHSRELRGEAVRLSVTDQGAGISHEHIARLTERFYRVDTHRSREVGGTGLGLAIVKHILNRHRGRLRIESEPGKGSIFTIILPTQT